VKEETVDNIERVKRIDRKYLYVVFALLVLAPLTFLYW
jgi:hypothetical protein